MADFEIDDGFTYQAADLARLTGEILGTGRSLRLRVRGGSMRPFIKDGDLLEVYPVESADIHLGDILLFNFANQEMFVHRVVRIQKRKGGLSPCFITQGDAVLCPDGCIDPEDVLGRVIYVQHADRRRRLDTRFQRSIAFCLVIGFSGLKNLYRKLSP